MGKFKAGTFNGSQMRKLIKDIRFDEVLNPAEISAWLSLKSVLANFHGNHRNSKYQKMVDELIQISANLVRIMSMKMHFLPSHLDYFPENF